MCFPALLASSELIKRDWQKAGSASSILKCNWQTLLMKNSNWKMFSSELLLPEVFFVRFLFLFYFLFLELICWEGGYCWFGGVFFGNNFYFSVAILSPLHCIMSVLIWKCNRTSVKAGSLSDTECAIFRIRKSLIKKSIHESRKCKKPLNKRKIKMFFKSCKHLLCDIIFYFYHV